MYGGEYGPPPGRYGQSPRERRWPFRVLVAVLAIAVVYLAYTRVYVPWNDHATAAVVASGLQFSEVPTGVPASASAGASAATTPPTLAWKPWLAGDGGKAMTSLELGDTTLVDARQKAQAALASGKDVSAAGVALAKAAAAELKAVASARTAPLPPKSAQRSWAKAMADLTQGSGQLAKAAKYMQAGNKPAASNAIAASMSGMNAAFDELTSVQQGIPSP